VIAASGAISHSKIVDLSEKFFGKIPTNPPADKKVYKEPAHFIGSDRRIFYETWDKAHIAFAYPVGGWSDPDTYPLMIIQQLLGAWDSETAGGSGKHSTSYLIKELSTVGCAQSVAPFNTQYSDTSLFGLYIVCHPVGAQNLMWHAVKSFTHLAYEVDEAQLEAAKNQIKYQILASLDGSTSIAEDIGRQLLCYGRRIHPAEQIARVEAVDANAVKQAARRFFYDRDHALAAMGHLYEIPDYSSLRRRSYLARY
jgi:processing peptidase subunit beta